MVTKRRLGKFVLASLLIATVWIVGAWLKFLYTPVVTDEHGLRYIVRAGASVRAVIDDLYVRNIVKHPFFFRILARTKNVSHDLKAGEYLFPKGATPIKILQQVATGSGLVYHLFTIVPGWKFQELRAALQRDENFHHSVLGMTDEDIMKKLNHSELKPEGEFFPDTYYFVEGSDDFSILKRSFKTMQDKLNKAWQHRAADLPFKTPYDALIAASIIEKETRIEDELPKIAGVMVNRLRTGMLLQFDPTVIYGKGAEFDGKIYRSDLQSDNPYNTYVHKGLPPTPISLPSLAAIDAVMNPQKHEYFYFVAQSNGSSSFTKHLADHNKAVSDARTIKWFFNHALARYYLLKLFSQRIYTN